jgi:hypothetical protein
LLDVFNKHKRDFHPPSRSEDIKAIIVEFDVPQPPKIQIVAAYPT